MKDVISLNQDFIIIFFVKNVHELNTVCIFSMKLKLYKANMATQPEMNYM